MINLVRRVNLMQEGLRLTCPSLPANYLSELRKHRMTRPCGGRAQPSGARPAPSRNSTGRYSLDAASQADGVSGNQRVPSYAPSTAVGSVSSRHTAASGRASRDYYPEQSARQPLKPSDVVPTANYIERGQRWMEKEEAYSLRDAMDEMDLRSKANAPEAADDDGRIYNAALDEAAELVWRHQNGGRLPRPDGPYRYRPHLRKNSYAHARTASVGSYGDGIAPSGLARDCGSRSVSGSSSGSDNSSQPLRSSMEAPSPGVKAKPYGSVGSRPGQPPAVRRTSSMKRKISGEVERPFSGDQIWEEPETESTHSKIRSRGATADTLGSRSENTGGKVRFEQRREDVGAGATKPPYRVELHKNPPTRSRNPQYTTNTAPARREDDDQEGKKRGMEIRGQDIRDATSVSLKHRSSRLPEPTAVSDSPGRPIVSFDANWRAPDESTDVSPDRQACKERATARDNRQPMVVPVIRVEENHTTQSRPPSRPPVPSINVAAVDGQDESMAPPTTCVPGIAVDEPPGSGPVPTISISNDSSSSDPRPLPAPGARPARPRQAQWPRSHWSPAAGAAAGRVTAVCHECGLPIEGRFVALAGVPERFHPQCFRCYSCGISLEAMEISPEPEAVRNERLERIRRRDAGETLAQGTTASEDGDDRLRFYCHLDWHELFAPRCKHCRTPILGEHVVALGEHWHNGHFFCAECGDPFQHGMTHIEKDGYAWCIGCQTKRTERRAPKCRKCRQPVIGQYIQALGGEWHDACFRCAECQGGFDDGQIFPKEVEGQTVVLCTPCRAKELKL